jgi:hypothetical protein
VTVVINEMDVVAPQRPEDARPAPPAAEPAPATTLRLVEREVRTRAERAHRLRAY